ncbi:MAG: lysylphosphatidylglycerol synthase transmembrane domain-containing protein [Nevskiales bacterium]
MQPLERKFGTRLTVAVVFTVGMLLTLMAVGLYLAGPQAVLQLLKQAGWGLVGLLLLLSLCNYALRTWRWLLFARAVKLEVPGRANALYYLAGFSMATTPGKLGEVLRLWLLKRGHDYGYHRSLPLMIGDRISDLYGTLVLCLLAMAFLQNKLWVVALVAGLLGFATALLVWPQPVMTLIDTVYSRLRRWPRVFAGARHTLRHTRRLLLPRTAWLALGASVAGWFAESLALYFLLHALDSQVSLAQAVFAFTFAMMLGGVSMLPGGLGATEAGLAAMLIGFNVDTASAVVATALIRITTLWFAVGLGIVLLPWAVRTCNAHRALTVAI